MHTAKDIENLIRPYSLTLSDLPVTHETNSFAYSAKEHEKAKEMVKCHVNNFGGICTSDALDFVCHQSDVIELLCMALEASNKKMRELLDKEEVEFGMTRGRAMMIFQDINNSKYDDEEKEKAINVVLNSKDMQCIDKEYFIAVMKWMYDLMDRYMI